MIHSDFRVASARIDGEGHKKWREGKDFCSTACPESAQDAALCVCKANLVSRTVENSKEMAVFGVEVALFLIFAKNA